MCRTLPAVFRFRRSGQPKWSSQVLLTTDQARDALDRKGVSVTSWAVANNFNPNLVLDILAGRRKAVRGQSHQIAVKLGIKHGELCSDPANALTA